MIVVGLSVLVLVGAGVGYLQIRRRAAAEQARIAASAPVDSKGSSPQPPPDGTVKPEISGSAQTPNASQEPQPIPGSEPGQPPGAPTQRPNVPPSVDSTSPRPSARQGKPIVAGRAQPPPPAVPPYQQAHESAEQAFAAARYIEPLDDSALYWARRAKLQGDPAADQIEQQVLERMTATVQAARGARNNELATALLAKLTPLFPRSQELQQMNTTIRQEQEEYAKQIERQRQEAELRAQTKQFALRHRHVVGLQSLKPIYSYCEGILRITPDGIARFDCTRTADQRGRCDHVIFNAGDVKELRLNSDGSLHLAARSSGNFDFYGNPSAIQGSLDALRGLVRK